MLHRQKQYILTRIAKKRNPQLQTTKRGAKEISEFYEGRGDLIKQLEATGMFEFANTVLTSRSQSFRRYASDWPACKKANGRRKI